MGIGRRQLAIALCLLWVSIPDAFSQRPQLGPLEVRVSTAQELADAVAQFGASGLNTSIYLPGQGLISRRELDPCGCAAPGKQSYSPHLPEEGFSALDEAKSSAARQSADWPRLALVGVPAGPRRIQGLLLRLPDHCS